MHANFTIYNMSWRALFYCRHLLDSVDPNCCWAPRRVVVNQMFFKFCWVTGLHFCFSFRSSNRTPHWCYFRIFYLLKTGVMDRCWWISLYLYQNIPFSPSSDSIVCIISWIDSTCQKEISIKILNTHVKRQWRDEEIRWCENPAPLFYHCYDCLLCIVHLHFRYTF